VTCELLDVPVVHASMPTLSMVAVATLSMVAVAELVR
jgi:hypothetical protein